MTAMLTGKSLRMAVTITPNYQFPTPKKLCHEDGSFAYLLCLGPG